MKIFDKETPSDLGIPELDEKTKAEIDAMDAEWERDKEVMNEIHEPIFAYHHREAITY